MIPAIPSRATDCRLVQAPAFTQPAPAPRKATEPAKATIEVFETLGAEYGRGVRQKDGTLEFESVEEAKGKGLPAFLFKTCDDYLLLQTGLGHRPRANALALWSTQVSNEGMKHLAALKHLPTN